MASSKASRARYDGDPKPVLQALKDAIKNEKSLFYPIGEGARRTPRLLVKHASLMRALRDIQPTNMSFKTQMLRNCLKSVVYDKEIKFESQAVEAKQKMT